MGVHRSFHSKTGLGPWDKVGGFGLHYDIFRVKWLDMKYDVVVRGLVEVSLKHGDMPAKDGLQHGCQMGVR